MPNGTRRGSGRGCWNAYRIGARVWLILTLTGLEVLSRLPWWATVGAVGHDVRMRPASGQAAIEGGNRSLEQQPRVDSLLDPEKLPA